MVLRQSNQLWRYVLARSEEANGGYSAVFTRRVHVWMCMYTRMPVNQATLS